MSLVVCSLELQLVLTLYLTGTPQPHSSREGGGGGGGSEPTILPYHIGPFKKRGLSINSDRSAPLSAGLSTPEHCQLTVGSPWHNCLLNCRHSLSYPLIQNKTTTLGQVQGSILRAARVWTIREPLTASKL